MQINEIHLRNFMGVDYASLELSSAFSFVIADKNENNKSAFIEAIKFIIGPEYCNPDEVRKFAKNSAKREGYVRIHFLIRKDEKEEPKALVAMRALEKINVVFYKIGDETSDYISIEKFQKQFETNTITSYPFLDCDLSQFEEGTNVLYFWNFNMSETLKSYNTNISNLINNLSEDKMRLLQIALKHQRMLVNYEKIEKFKIFINLTKSMNENFQKITFGKFSALFFVEDNGAFADLTTFNLDNGKFKEIVTLICSENQSHIWTSREPYLRQLLKIAAKISFAYQFNQKIIFLKDDGSLSEHQNIELVKTAILENSAPNEEGEDAARAERCTNYIQNIVDVCTSLNLTVIFEYEGVVEHINGTNIIRCAEKGAASSFNIGRREFLLEDLSSMLGETDAPHST